MMCQRGLIWQCQVNALFVRLNVTEVNWKRRTETLEARR